MYAAVRRYEGINDDDEAARLVRDSFMPQLEKVQGSTTGSTQAKASWLH